MRTTLYAFMSLLVSSINVGVFCFAVGPKSTSTGLSQQQITALWATATSGAIASNDDDDDDDDDDNQVVYMRGGGKDASQVSRWPSNDVLDRKLIAISLPCILNFAINPLVGAVDLFWVNRMGNALAVAGQAAANQVFNSAFWLASFLPSVTATLVSKEYAKGDKESVQDAVCQALFFGALLAFMSTPLVLFNPDKVLSIVLEEGAPAMEFARPYLLIRAFAFLPSFATVIGFSAFRGILDTVTPVKIALFANLFNIVFDPLLIFGARLGVAGAAWATLGAELLSAVIYLVMMRKKELIRISKIFKYPAWEKLEPLVRGGAALQLRNFALNLTFLAVTRVTQSIDNSGVAAAAHALAIQTFQIGGIVLLALSTVAQTVVPNEMVEQYDAKTKKTIGGPRATKALVNRLMSWGFVLGSVLGALQMLVLPMLHRSTPLPEVREAAKLPSILASIYQVFNGLVFIGEGVMIGTGNFFQLSLSTVCATAGCLWALNTFPKRFGLAGVWMGFGVFNGIRLLGVALNQMQTGPLAWRNINKQQMSDEKV